jgi:integration host factor subunit alpha
VTALGLGQYRGQAMLNNKYKYRSSIDLVHEKIGFSRHESAEVVEAALDVLKEALQKGERVQIVGFGSFLVRPKKERVGRNPKTGEEITIAPRKVMTFKPSKILRDMVNDGGGA